MDKFLITRKSENIKTGPMMVTTSPRRTCPDACPFRKNSGTDQAGVCYAEHGMLGGFLWAKLDKLKVGETFKLGQIRIHDFNDLLTAIRSQPVGSIWRHNQAGDLPSKDRVHIDRIKLQAIVNANSGRNGFTYTHFDVVQNPHNRETVADANAKGFVVNLSANDLAHADILTDLHCGPVTTVLRSDQTDYLRTPKGRKVVVCPAENGGGVTCADCRLCARQRDCIVGFPAIGRGRRKLV